MYIYSHFSVDRRMPTLPHIHQHRHIYCFVLLQFLRRQYLFFCTSKASKLSTSGAPVILISTFCIIAGHRRYGLLLGTSRMTSGRSR